MHATADDHAELIATACRVLAQTSLSAHVLGHVSVRLGSDRVAIRCRGPREAGLAYTTADDVHAVGFDGTAESPDWSPPNELPIHTAVMRARPEVTAVVHAHPPAVVATTLAGLPLLPLVGAYDIVAARIAAGGVPLWPRAALVNTDELGDDVARSLGSRPIVALYGHGVVSVGVGEPERAVAQAVVNAVALEDLARLTLTVRSAGAEPSAISDDDLVQLPDLGSGFDVETRWRNLVAGLVPTGTAAVPPLR